MVSLRAQVSEELGIVSLMLVDDNSYLFFNDAVLCVHGGPESIAPFCPDVVSPDRNLLLAVGWFG
jgi:hypothetical protein